MWIVFGRDISLVQRTREISLHKNNSHDLHRVITHSLVLVIVPGKTSGYLQSHSILIIYPVFLFIVYIFSHIFSAITGMNTLAHVLMMVIMIMIMMIVIMMMMIMMMIIMLKRWGGECDRSSHIFSWQSWCLNMTTLRKRGGRVSWPSMDLPLPFEQLFMC